MQPSLTIQDLVKYIREQLQRLDELPTAFLLEGVTPWSLPQPLPDCTHIERTALIEETVAAKFFARNVDPSKAGKTVKAKPADAI